MQFNRPTTLKKTSADTSIKAWKHPKSIEYSAGSMTTFTPYKHLKEKFEVWVFNDIENFDEGEGADLLEECIKQIHLTPEGSHVGYRKIRHLLCTKYGINIHLVLKRCVFDVEGPDFIWPANGHDKLKKFGLTIYGFIDAWSCKVLGILVHTTNNNPRHIGYYYLQLVKEVGGIPQRTTTD
ncbi:hypothetical protein MJO28_009918 [Puccinia striiformis f. sp. tritici]|uniref:Uncharacterized protein n=1 Tax=Puccinia striiformis f. sp. tritici TaxID=168172 RepID=A0ACC0EA27_9BASI|nr:hypothetical protein MJO28_009918 [Puccinia striiformis f. sp. tritici]